MGGQRCDEDALWQHRGVWQVDCRADHEKNTQKGGPSLSQREDGINVFFKLAKQFCLMVKPGSRLVLPHMNHMTQTS